MQQLAITGWGQSSESNKRLFDVTLPVTDNFFPTSLIWHLTERRNKYRPVTTERVGWSCVLSFKHSEEEITTWYIKHLTSNERNEHIQPTPGSSIVFVFPHSFTVLLPWDLCLQDINYSLWRTWPWDAVSTFQMQAKNVHLVIFFTVSSTLIFSTVV